MSAISLVDLYEFQKTQEERTKKEAQQNANKEVSHVPVSSANK